MKIFSSELERNTTVVNGQLDITTQDSIIIRDAGNGAYATDGRSFTTTPTQGLYIEGDIATTATDLFDQRIAFTDDVGNLNASTISYLYLDGKGQHRELTDVLVTSVSFDSSTNMLSFHGGGQTTTSLFPLVDLSTLAGASSGGAAATNQTNGDLPVKRTNGFSTAFFADSAVSEIDTVTAATFYSANPNAAVLPAADDFTFTLTGQTATDFAATYSNNDDTQFALSTSLTNPINVTLTTTDSATWTVTPRGASTLPAIAQSDTIQFINVDTAYAVTGVAVDGNLTVSGNTTVTGNLDVTGTTNFRHQAVSTYSDTFLELNVAQDVDSEDAGAATGGTDGVGGILVESDFSRAAGVATGTQFGGLRFNGAADGGNGQWEYNLNATAAGGNGTADATPGQLRPAGVWVPFAGGGAGLSKFTALFSSVTAGTSGTSNTYTFNHGILASDGDDDLEDLIVQVYESNVQIIPENITIVSDGTVVVSLPTAAVGAGAGQVAVANLKVVIIG